MDPRQESKRRRVDTFHTCPPPSPAAPGWLVLPSHLCQALQRHVAKGRLGKQLQQHLQQVPLEDVAQRHPGQEHAERLQRGPNELRLARVVQHEHAQLVDSFEFHRERLLELLRFGLREVQSGEVEHLLAEKLENFHAVFAQRLAGAGSCYEVGDKALPARRPVVLQNLDQQDVELVDEGALLAEQLLGLGEPDNEV